MCRKINKEELSQILGVNCPLEIIGTITVLRNVPNLPFVFLFDEDHNNTNNCIDSNIENAVELCRKANVRIVGVESFAGGKSWDSDRMTYSENYSSKKLDDYYTKNYKNANTKFVDELKNKCNVFIQGVESFAMMHRIGMDLSEPVSNLFGKPVEDHPLHVNRSKHHIRTLLEEYFLNELDGNLILNCGLNHNTHIEDWIRNVEIDRITGYPANYIRFNAIH